VPRGGHWTSSSFVLPGMARDGTYAFCILPSGQPPYMPVTHGSIEEDGRVELSRS
jgi:hypothetical protein